MNIYLLKIKIIFEHPTVKNIYWIMIERASQILLGIFVSGLIARYFGVELYGRWQYSLTLIAIAMTFTWICGAEVVLPKLSTTNFKDQGSVLGTAFALRFLVSFFVAVIFYCLIPILFKNDEVVMILLGLGITIIFREPSMVAFAWFQSQTNVKPAMIINIAALSLKALLIYLLITFKQPLIYFAIVWSFESILVGFLLLYQLFKKKLFSYSFDKIIFFEFIQKGFFIWLGLVFMTIFLRIDRIFLERTLNSNEYGLYVAATQLNDNWTAMGVILAQSVAPYLIYNVYDKGNLRRNVLKLLTLTIMLSITGVLILILFSKFLILSVFGVNYLDSTELFEKIIWLSLPINVEAILNTLILKKGASKFYAFKWATTLLLSVVLCNWLVPLMGVNGAFFSLYASIIYTLLITIIYIKYIRII